ncbi:MAG: 2OG-Fe(II) oxygenase [Alphaproteobacteria bacterium]|nr:2OG-Fe(II) oxygenase [Alphaproteobacteria bacterium]
MGEKGFHPTLAFQVWDNVFTPEELDRIEAYGDTLTQMWGSVSYDGPADQQKQDDIRVVREAVMPPKPEILWLYNALERVIRTINKQVWQFDLYGFSEPFKYMVYHGSDRGHFDWHADNGVLDNPRKLSASLQLTDGVTYEGCDLEIHGGYPMLAAPRERGALIVFPSYVLHRVTPIRAGTRKALVLWSTGPQFR